MPDEIVDGALALRAWTVDAAPEMERVVTANLAHLRPFQPWVAQEPLTPAARVALIEQWQAERAAGMQAPYGIWSDGRLVGSTGVHHRIGPDGLEIGYWVAAADCGRGIATWAARSMTSAAFTQGQVSYVEIHHDPTNEVSGRIPARLGFEQVGTIIPDRPLAPAETGVSVVWRLTREAWRAQT